MKASVVTFILIVCSLMLSSQITAQDKRFVNQCDLLRTFVDSADRTFFDFSRHVPDSVIQILDIDNLLTDCRIIKIRGITISVVSDGSEVERIRKGGIFKAEIMRADSYILTKKYLKGLIGYRLYNNKSGGDFYWGLKKEGTALILKKKSVGWF